MKQFTLLILIIPFFIGCKQNNPPKNIVAKFILSLNKLDFDKAASFLTKETQPIFLETKTELQNSYDFKTKMKNSEYLSDKKIIEDYDLDHLTESMINNNAIVQSSDSSSQIILEKINGIWKIVCTKNFLNQILIGNSKNEYVTDSSTNTTDNFSISSQNKSLAEAYSDLITYFQEQVDITRTVIKASPNSETTALTKKIAEITNLYNDDTEIEMSNILIINSKQNELNKLILDFLRTTNLHPEISIQLENCEKEIQISRLNYNRAVSDYKSGFGLKPKTIPLN